MKFKKLLLGLPLLLLSSLHHGHHRVEVMKKDVGVSKLTIETDNPNTDNVDNNIDNGDKKKTTFGPATMALLDTIAFAEGTSKYPNKGYNTQFTGRQFSSVNHPRQVLSSGWHRSDAAGRYQFLSTTWDSVGGGPMTPERQDKGAVRLIIKRLKAAGIRVNNANDLEYLLKTEGLSRRILAALAPEWASLPTIYGGSYYGQPAKSHARLQSYFNSLL